MFNCFLRRNRKSGNARLSSTYFYQESKIKNKIKRRMLIIECHNHLFYVFT